MEKVMVGFSEDSGSARNCPQDDVTPVRLRKQLDRVCRQLGWENTTLQRELRAEAVWKILQHNPGTYRNKDFHWEICTRGIRSMQKTEFKIAADHGDRRARYTEYNRL